MTTSENEVQQFNRGEKVLCYEPDKSKARVLYDSKILAVYERKDATNRRYYDYKIHFQGWNASWDRNVRAASLLKDNEENRRLQRELAEAGQLQKSGGYSYKDTKSPAVQAVPAVKKKRMTRGYVFVDELVDPLDTSEVTQLPVAQDEIPMQQKSGNRSRDNSGGRKLDKSTATPGEDGAARSSRKNGRVDVKSERKNNKSMYIVQNVSHTKVEEDSAVRPEDRVVLRISERLREYMEYDFDMICKFQKLHSLPARMPIVTILENFVKQRAVELAIGIKQDSSRSRFTNRRCALMEREYDRVMSNVCMLKEVVDGLRIYFEFHLEEHLLYAHEKEFVSGFLTEENMKACSVLWNRSYEFINPNGDNEHISMDNNVHVTNGGGSGSADGAILIDIENEKQLQKCLRYIVKNSCKNNLSKAYDQRTSPYIAAYKLPLEMRGFLCETFNWTLLSDQSPPEKSMIFGAPHLARLLIVLPEYLNVSPISNEKLNDLLPHLSSFINYLENHKEWFDKQNYLTDAFIVNNK